MAAWIVPWSVGTLIVLAAAGLEMDPIDTIVPTKMIFKVDVASFFGEPEALRLSHHRYGVARLPKLETCKDC